MSDRPEPIQVPYAYSQAVCSRRWSTLGTGLGGCTFEVGETIYLFSFTRNLHSDMLESASSCRWHLARNQPTMPAKPIMTTIPAIAPPAAPEIMTVLTSGPSFTLAGYDHPNFVPIWLRLHDVNRLRSHDVQAYPLTTQLFGGEWRGGAARKGVEHDVAGYYWTPQRCQSSTSAHIAHGRRRYPSKCRRRRPAARGPIRRPGHMCRASRRAPRSASLSTAARYEMR